VGREFRSNDFRYFIMVLSTKFASALVLLALLNICVVVVTNPYYFPDGNLASSYVPCLPNSDGDCFIDDFYKSLGYCISNLKMVTITVELAQMLHSLTLPFRITALPTQIIYIILLY
jgi:hypothetical protein